MVPRSPSSACLIFLCHAPTPRSHQDARFTHLHATPDYILALLMDEKPDAQWAHVMPGFDENLDIPGFLEPPRLDADEVLPSQLHPSYPFGRAEKGKKAAGGNLRAIAGNMMPQQEEGKWNELNLSALIQRPDGKEVPPVMAVSVVLGALGG